MQLKRLGDVGRVPNVRVGHSIARLSVANCVELGFRLRASATTDVTVRWGDGTTTTKSVGPDDDVPFSHDYSFTFEGKIEISPAHMISVVKTASTVIPTPTWNTPLSEWAQFTNIVELDFRTRTTQNVIVGDVSELPRSLNTRFTMIAANEITGDVADLPRGLKRYTLRGDEGGNGTLFGDVADLPPDSVFMDIGDNNTLTGVLADLPASFGNVILTGANTLGGNIADMPPEVTQFQVFGDNQLFGDLADLPSLGDPFVRPIYNIGGQNTISDYSGPLWRDDMGYIATFPVSGGLSSSEVDALINDLAAQDPLDDNGTIGLLGTNAPRTAASDDAVATLEAAGWTVDTN